MCRDLPSIGSHETGSSFPSDNRDTEASGPPNPTTAYTYITHEPQGLEQPDDQEYTVIPLRQSQRHTSGTANRPPASPEREEEDRKAQLGMNAVTYTKCAPYSRSKSEPEGEHHSSKVPGPVAESEAEKGPHYSRLQHNGVSASVIRRQHGKHNQPTAPSYRYSCPMSGLPDATKEQAVTRNSKQYNFDPLPPPTTAPSHPPLPELSPPPQPTELTYSVPYKPPRPPVPPQTTDTTVLIPGDVPGETAESWHAPQLTEALYAGGKSVELAPKEEQRQLASGKEQESLASGGKLAITSGGSEALYDNVFQLMGISEPGGHGSSDKAETALTDFIDSLEIYDTVQ